MNHLIVIDDTGSPGNPSQSKTLRSDRESFVGVFISKNDREKVINHIEYLKKSFSNPNRIIRELHFTDLINRRKDFKDFETDQVLNLFGAFVQMTRGLSFSIFLQTATERTLDENQMGFLKNLMTKKEKEPKILALNLLIIRISKYIEENNIQGPIDIFIDEGIKKDGQTINLDNFWECKNSYQATFKSSEGCIPIQLADFYAFSINRMQMLSIKENRTPFDKNLLAMISKSLEYKNISGLKGRHINIENFTKDDYDEIILESYEVNGNLESWKSVNK